MKRSIILITALLLAVAQGGWAQTVSTASGLISAVGTNNASIVLDADIQLESYLNIDEVTVTIDLNGHMLYRQIIGGYLSDGHVIYVHNHATLNLVNSTGTGSIKGGRANNGGGINIGPLCTVNASNVTFQDNTAGEHGGAIWNSGTLTATNCTFTNNSADDVGAVYNAAVESTYYGSASFTGCTFTGNSSSTSAGALANATGNTSMTLEGCTITGNTAQTNGGGIWNGGTLTITGNTSIIDNDCPGGYNGGGIYQLNGTLNISGNLVVKGNGSGNRRNNLYLAPDQVVTVAGTFASGAEIWLTNAPDNFYFTSGYHTYHSDSDPNRIFLYDNEDFRFTLLEGEVVRYEIVLSQDASYLKGDNTMGTQLGCHKVSLMSDYTGVVMENGWYVVDSDRTFEHRITIVGTVHLILPDGVTLNANEGIRVPDESTFHVWGQSCDGNTMGKLIADARAMNGCAGIGGDGGDPAGTMFFHGGNTVGRGSQMRGYGGAGIGGGSGGSCELITISGGAVAGYAVHPSETGTGAGIGSGSFGICKGVTITGGLVMAVASTGAGIGSGYNGFMHEPRGLYDPLPDGDKIYAITISGGYIVAQSGMGAGIGGGASSSNISDAWHGLAGHIFIDGGQIIASTQEANDPYYSQAIGHGKVLHQQVAEFGTRLYDDAKVLVGYNLDGTDMTYLDAGDRMRDDHTGPIQYLNIYKNVKIVPCDHPNGVNPCHYCGRTNSESISVTDASNNYSTLQSHDAHKVHVTLGDRTFWKDGSWNTLCLPFALDNFINTPLFGATVRSLTGASVTDGVLTLTFGDPVTAIEAGKPYIVKWDYGESITNPLFQNVKIDNHPLFTKVGDVTFRGTFSPTTLTADDKTRLYLGADNKLYYATSALDVNSFRGYFVLGENLQPNAVSSLVMDFGEEPVGELDVVEE